MKKRLIHIVNILIALGLATAVVYQTRPWEIWTLDADFLWRALAALTVNYLLVWFWAGRHATVLRASGADVRARQVLLLVTFSNAANNLTPAASGEIVRAWFLNRNLGVPIEGAAAAIVFERLFMFGLMLTTAVAAGGMALGSGWLVAGMVVAIGVYIWLTPRFLRPLAGWAQSRRGSRAGRIRNLIRGIASGGLQLWSQTAVTLRTTAWSVGSFSSMGLLFWLAASAIGLELTAAEIWALVGGATVVGVLSALPFGLGAAELSAVGIAALLGIEAQSIAAAFVLYRVLFTLPMALAGSYAYAKLSMAGERHQRV